MRRRSPITSEKHKRYNESEKGRARRRRWNKTQKGQQSHQRYEATRIRTCIGGMNNTYRVPAEKKDELVEQIRQYRARQPRTETEALEDGRID